MRSAWIVVACTPTGCGRCAIWRTASPRRRVACPSCWAARPRTSTEPAADAGPGNVPEVTITFPDGFECSSSDPVVHQRLSELVGREVRLTALPPLNDTSRHRLSLQQSKANFSAAEVRRDFGLAESDALPDTSVFTTKQILTLARFSTPPGTFVDLGPVHLMSSTSLASLSAQRRTVRRATVPAQRPGRRRSTGRRVPRVGVGGR